jgi:hypothetical protein
MSKMGSHDPFGHLQHKLWPREKPRVKLASQEMTWFPCMQVACNMPLESSRLGLQLRFIPHPDWRSTQEVIVMQGQFPCVQVACDTPLESSQWGLQLRFIPHPDRRSAQEVIVPQSYGTSNLGNFGTPIWESWDKKPFECHSHGEV